MSSKLMEIKLIGKEMWLWYKKGANVSLKFAGC